MSDDIDILTRLADLYIQATEENTHYYVANCVKDAIEEILRLRLVIANNNFSEDKP